MLDEVQTGNGRTGKYFAYQHEGIVPDVVTTAKGLGNGVPIGACLAHGAAADVFGPGNHGSTFGGNPLACAAGLAVVQTIEQENLCAKVEASGAFMRDSLQQSLAGNKRVKEIRGKGLMIGIELSEPCTELVKEAIDQQLLINVTAGNTIRLLPPFIIDQQQAQQIVATVTALVNGFNPAKAT
jgi:acetylornithine aminotransferase